MQIHTNISLKKYLTINLGGAARFMTDIQSPEEVSQIVKNAKKQNLKIFIIGHGSNVLANDDGFNGLVLRMRIPGFEIINDDISSTTIKIGAGENWDEVVRKTVEMNLSGIEAMSAIPGTAGATPIQNTGAYGQEIADTLQSLDAYDTQNNNFVTLQNDDCNFSYRNSIFRDTSSGRYIITSITIKLSKNAPQPPFYQALQNYFDAHKITLITPQIIRDSVIALRSEKLPDPKSLPNVGSFFKNTIVEDWQLKQIQKTFPDVPAFDMGDGTHKIPTGWLIEKTGLKGQLLHGIRIYDKNALILVNESATSFQDLMNARDEIARKVYDIFQVKITQEPLEM